MSDPSAYVRQIETYLCQRNKGHLVRIVGPAFDLVRAWEAQGVPLKVAFRGIDRCCERYDRKGPRRRPIRIEFCEADVLDAFDAWRRAVGVSGGGEPGGEAPRRPPLAAHVERAIARLAHVRGVGAATTDLHRQIEEIIRQLEEVVSSAVTARGEARARLVERLSEIDAALMSAAVGGLEPPRADALRREAREELAPFGARMLAGARKSAEDAAFIRLVREDQGLPTIAYE